MQCLWQGVLRRDPVESVYVLKFATSVRISALCIDFAKSTLSSDLTALLHLMPSQASRFARVKPFTIARSAACGLCQFELRPSETDFGRLLILQGEIEELHFSVYGVKQSKPVQPAASPAPPPVKRDLTPDGEAAPPPKRKKTRNAARGSVQTPDFAKIRELLDTERAAARTAVKQEKEQSTSPAMPDRQEPEALLFLLQTECLRELQDFDQLIESGGTLPPAVVDTLMDYFTQPLLPLDIRFRYLRLQIGADLGDSKSAGADQHRVPENRWQSIAALDSALGLLQESRPSKALDTVLDLARRPALLQVTDDASLKAGEATLRQLTRTAERPANGLTPEASLTFPTTLQLCVHLAESLLANLGSIDLRKPDVVGRALRSGCPGISKAIVPSISSLLTASLEALEKQVEAFFLARLQDEALYSHFYTLSTLLTTCRLAAQFRDLDLPTEVVSSLSARLDCLPLFDQAASLRGFFAVVKRWHGPTLSTLQAFLPTIPRSDSPRAKEWNAALSSYHPQLVQLLLFAPTHLADATNVLAELAQMDVAQGCFHLLAIFRQLLQNLKTGAQDQATLSLYGDAHLRTVVQLLQACAGHIPDDASLSDDEHRCLAWTKHIDVEASDSILSKVVDLFSLPPAIVSGSQSLFIPALLGMPAEVEGDAPAYTVKQYVGKEFRQRALSSTANVRLPSMHVDNFVASQAMQRTPSGGSNMSNG